MAAGPDLVYFCDWLPPEFGAVGQYALIRAGGFAAEGRRVALYGLSSASDSVEVEHRASGELRIVRLKAPTYDRTRLIQRALWTARTDLRLVVRAWKDLRSCREILFTGSPPFMLHLMAPLNWLLRRKLVYRITDMFPEALIAAMPRVPWFLRLFHRLTIFWRKRVDRFEVLGEDQRTLLVRQGIAPERITLVRDPSPVIITPGTKPLPIPQQLQGRKVLLYSGNFGVAHEYETFVQAYTKFHAEGSGKVALWLNAIGAGADAVERELSGRRLPFFRTQPLPLDRVANLLVTPAAHLITLRKAFVGIVVPSKVFGCIDSGRDIIYLGPEESDLHLLCHAKMTPGRYTRVDIGDVVAMVRALEELAASDAHVPA
ncbi:MAG: hypothetical protein IT514_10470 [Burkholderiales bacterium]|nr:hypothetical protein [Burkholderiales bacterium]